MREAHAAIERRLGRKGLNIPAADLIRESAKMFHCPAVSLPFMRVGISPLTASPAAAQKMALDAADDHIRAQVETENEPGYVCVSNSFTLLF